MLQFIEDLATFKAFVSGINADGSGDTPGDFLGETEAALNLGWSSRNKVVEWETLPNTDHDSTI